ncbi:MAG: hypothetical protein ACRDKI_02350 [Solirubrobacterales bacterium]
MWHDEVARQPGGITGPTPAALAMPTRAERVVLDQPQDPVYPVVAAPAMRQRSPQAAPLFRQPNG